MYGGYDVYKVYLAVKLHFTSKNYDYIKYDGKVNATLDSFTKRHDKYFFHKLSTKYKKDDILDFFVSNFCADSKKWIGNLIKNDGQDVYLDFKKWKQSFNYNFKSDCVLVCNDFNSRRISFDNGILVFGGQHPRFLQLLLQRKISLQTAIVFDYFLSFIKDWNSEIKEKVVWPDMEKKIQKVKAFINFNPVECKKIMKEVFIDGE